MGKTKNWRLLAITFLIIATTAFLLSCSNVRSNSSPTLTAGPAETSPSPTLTVKPTSTSPSPTSTFQPTVTSPSPTINAELPTIQNYKDLDSLRLDDPANIDNSKFPITPVSALRVISQAPPIDMTKYTILVDGLVNTPLSLNYAAILKYPTVSEVVLLICEGAFVDNAEWTGVPVTTLLTEAGVKSEATKVAFIAIGGYEIELNLKDVQKDGVFLAYIVNGEILPQEHGYPVRLVVKGKYGSFWVKWVNRLRIQ